MSIISNLIHVFDSQIEIMLNISEYIYCYVYNSDHVWIYPPVPATCWRKELKAMILYFIIYLYYMDLV